MVDWTQYIPHTTGKENGLGTQKLPTKEWMCANSKNNKQGLKQSQPTTYCVESVGQII